MTRLLKLVSAALLVFVLAAAGTEAQAGGCNRAGGCFVMRAPHGQIPAIAQAHGLEVLEQLADGRPDAVLVGGPESVPPAQTRAAIESDSAVTDVEPLALARLTENASGAFADPHDPASEGLAATGEAGGDLSQFFSAALWSGYADQAAVHLLGLPELHALPYAEATGAGVVALIDTGVDAEHPLLQGALVAGYDFVLDRAGFASEWESLDPADRGGVEEQLKGIADQSYATILEGGGQAIVLDASIAVINSSEAPQLDGESLPDAFGHGTMVAGLVRLAAPAARIMPLRVFDGDGSADIFRIIQAVYYAVDHGADVINMSFSIGELSRELRRALQYARSHGVVCVSSAGNTGDASLTYPAAYNNTVGVASTNLVDEPSAFSSHGADLVTLAAPGEEVVSLFPGGGYAVGWGTSFSSALVSGAVALLHSLEDGALTTIRYNRAKRALENSARTVDAAAQGLLPEDLGAGRLDAFDAFGQGLHGF